MRITADTNIYISALYFGGKPLQFLRRAIDGDFELAISNAILMEVLRVAEQKFGASNEDVRSTKQVILELATLYSTTSSINALKDDPSDNRILECAVDSRSNFIVTGDNDLLRLKEFREIKIVTLRDTLALLDPVA